MAELVRIQEKRGKFVVIGRVDADSDWYDIESCDTREAAEFLADKLRDSQELLESYIDEIIEGVDYEEEEEEE
jgi:hypothetical protein